MAETVRCDRCHVDVLVEKLNPPAPFVRCLDHRCPLHPAEVNAKLAAAFAAVQAAKIGSPMP